MQEQTIHVTVCDDDYDTKLRDALCDSADFVTHIRKTASAISGHMQWLREALYEHHQIAMQGLWFDLRTYAGLVHDDYNEWLPVIPALRQLTTENVEMSYLWWTRIDAETIVDELLALAARLESSPKVHIKEPTVREAARVIGRHPGITHKDLATEISRSPSHVRKDIASKLHEHGYTYDKGWHPPGS